MKKLVITSIILISCFFTFASTPGLVNYQAALRNPDGTPMAETDVSFEISILEGSATGSSVYTETHNVETSSQGIVNLLIGDGSSTDDFSVIDWSAGTFYLKVKVDPEGGSDYSHYGTSQLLSVPYAIHAETAENAKTAETATTAENVDDADADPENELQSLSVSGTSLSISESNTVSLPTSYTSLSTNKLSIGTTSALPINSIIEITGTTDDAANYVYLNLPLGYTMSNTRILSVEIETSIISPLGSLKNYHGLGYSNSGSTLGYSLQSFTRTGTKKSVESIKIYYPDGLKKKKFRVTLLRVQERILRTI